MKMNNTGILLKQTSLWKSITILPPVRQMAFELIATFTGWQGKNQPFKTGNDPVTDTITAVKQKANQTVYR